MLGAASWVDAFRMNGKGVGLNVMPLYHIGGIITNVCSLMVSGAALVCAPSLSDVETMDWLKHFGMAYFSSVPTAHGQLLQIFQDASVEDREAVKLTKFYESVSLLLDYAGPCPYGALRHSSLLMQMRGTIFGTMQVTVRGMIGSGLRCSAADCVIVGAIAGSVTGFRRLAVRRDMCPPNDGATYLNIVFSPMAICQVTRRVAVASMPSARSSPRLAHASTSPTVCFAISSQRSSMKRRRR